MSPVGRLLDPSLAGAVGGWLGAHPLAAEGTRPALRWLHGPDGPLPAGQKADRIDLASVLATAASVDMSVAFSLWSHRMVIAYLRAAGDVEAARRWLPLLEPAEIAGTTGLAAAMAHHVCGEPLSVDGKSSGDGLQLDGRIRWASNLFGTGFLLITAANLGGQGVHIVAMPGDQPGLAVDVPPRLLDLQATFSSSLRLTDVRLGSQAIVARDFDRFIRAVRPTFLLWQSSFAWGLAARALAEAAPRIGRGPNTVFGPELVALEDERDRIESRILAALAEDEGSVSQNLAAIVATRLESARLAGAATRLECKVSGGAGYASESATARRLREAAFLPIQSPTEGQLQWELQRLR